MNVAVDHYRCDLKIVAYIIRTAILDLYAPLTAGYSDLPSTLRPPAVHVLAMYENPQVRISRQMGRACNHTAFRNALSTIGGANLNRAARTAACEPIPEGFKTSHP
jgi:hypothetical protein